MKIDSTKKSIAIWILGIVGVILLCIYVMVSLYYRERFFPKTTINGTNYGNATVTEVAEDFKARIQDYCLEVHGRDLDTGEETLLFIIDAEDIGLCVTIENMQIKALLQRQNGFLWPIYMGRSYEYHLQGDARFDEKELTAFLERQDAFQEHMTQGPKDAYIQGYSEEIQDFVLVPEVQGNRLQIQAADEAISAAIMQGLDWISFEENGCYLEPAILSTSEALRANLAQAQKWLETQITYDWNSSEVQLTREQVQNWIVLKDGMLTLDKSAIAEFVAANAEQYDTYGKNRVFHTTMGYDLTLPGGAFGWLTDREAEVSALTELIQEGYVGEREPVYASKAPWRGGNDIGNSYVEADLTHQHLYLYQKGTMVLETDFVSGNMSKNYVTPQGVFGITYKTTNAILRGGDYAEHVNYWMPYHGNYGMHDATWRENFGGDIYLTDGSHGCINLPLDKAGEVYQYVTEGFPVICYYYPPGVLPEPVYDDSMDEDD